MSTPHGRHVRRRPSIMEQDGQAHEEMKWTPSRRASRGRSSTPSSSTWTASSPRRPRVHAAAWKRLFDAYLSERAARTGTSPGGAPGTQRCGRSSSRPTTACTWTASRATTASATSWPRAASSCPKATGRPAGAGDRLRARQSQERASSTRRSRERSQDVPLHGRAHPPSCRRGDQGRPHVVEQEHRHGARRHRHDGPVRGPVDGVVAADVGLPGKPDPAMYLETARRLGVDAARYGVVEDALSGVEAGRRGGFGLGDRRRQARPGGGTREGRRRRRRG